MSDGAAASPTAYLSLDEVIALGEHLLRADFAVRDLGLLGSAIARPHTSAFGEDAYPDLFTKAAALLHSLVANHALIDGNKRLGWLATAVMLRLNGVDATRASDDDVYQLVMSVATGSVRDVDTIARGLRDIVGE